MRIIYFILILLLVGCKDSEKEVLDMNDLIPQSENYKEGEIKMDSPEKPLEKPSLNLNTDLLDKLGILYQNYTQTDSLLFPDRFSPKSLNKFNYTTENEVILFSEYGFKDSLKTFNAFLNWCNCFGSNCKSISIGENKNLQKEGFLMMVNDTSIIFISTNSNAEKKKWKSYFTNEKDIRWHYVLEQSKHGKVKWQSFESNIYTTIQARNLIE